MNSLAAEDPIHIVRYAIRNHLVDNPYFKWIVQFCQSKDITGSSNLVRAFKTKVKGNAKKFKFGVQVPRGTKEEFVLDEQNGNDL